MFFTDATFLIRDQRKKKHLNIKAIFFCGKFLSRAEKVLWKKNNDSEQRKTDRCWLEAVVSLIFLWTETSGQTQPEELAVKK